MNTSDATMSLESLAVHALLGSDPSGRSAYFAQGIFESLPAQLPCLEKGGDLGDTTIQTTSRVQFNRSTASDGMIESEDTTTRTASYNQPPVMMNEESSQGLNQGLAQEGNKPQETIKEVTPVAHRTRSCRHQTDSIRIEKDKGDNGNDTNRNMIDKELIRRLLKINKE